MPLRLFLLLLFTSAASCAQVIENPVKSLKGKRDFIYGLDNRRTHIKGQSTVIYGVYFGFGLEDKLRFKIGISGTPFEVGRTQDAQGDITRHRLIFLTLGEEFDFFIQNRFRTTTYIQAGAGFDYSRITYSNGGVSDFNRNFIVPIEFGLHVNYDVYPWLRAKLGGGWRVVLPNDSQELSGYYIKAGLGFSYKKFVHWNQEKNQKKLRCVNSLRCVE
jgi:hypothetical protein